MARKPSIITLANGEKIRLEDYPLPEGVPDGLLNKKQICEALQVSQPTLDDWRSRGMPWQHDATKRSPKFQLSHCWAWRKAYEAKRVQSLAEGRKIADAAAAKILNADAPTDPEADGNPHTRKAWADFALRQMRVDEMRGNLVRADKVREALDKIFEICRKGMNNLPDYAEGAFALDAGQVDELQGKCNDTLAEMQAEMRAVFNPGASVHALKDAKTK